MTTGKASRSAACLAALLLCPALPPGAARADAVVSAHRRHAQAAPMAGASPVVLSAAPGTALDAEARTLNADDLQDAAKHHDHVVVLIGSAPLSSKGDEQALFVQLQSARLCGSAGCTTSVYLRRGSDWKTVLDSVNGDISVLPARHKGMHDLLVDGNDRWVWDGSQYQDTLGAPPAPAPKPKAAPNARLRG